MAVYSGTILLRINRTYNGNTYNSDTTLSFNTSSVGSSSIGFDSRMDYYFLGCRLTGLYKDGRGISSSDVPITIGLEGRCSGGFLIPLGTTNGSDISGGVSLIPETPQVVFATAFGGSDIPVDISANGLYYEDSNGNWLKVSDNTLVATASEVSNLPSGVDFNGWLVDHEIIEGDDGKYYDLAGNELFQNLPSGVIPVSQIISPNDDGSGNLSNGIFEGSDGNYYNVSGIEVLENLPSGVTPSSQIGDIIVGSDGGYYDLHGDLVMENLPSGVTITGYDSENDVYKGSDGKDYDIHGDEVEVDPGSECDGELLQYGNNFRLTFKGVDVFGNDFTFYKDVNPSVNTIVLDSNTVSTIRKIDRITIRNLDNGYSTGNSRLKITSRVVGFRVGIDIDTVDPDFVMGNFTVCDCLFHTCDKYADVVLNSDLPLGFVPNTSSLDVGIYCLIDALWLDWSLDNNTQFPYCCGSYVEAEKGSGSTSDNNDSSNSDIVEAIEKLTDAVKELSCLVEVVVSPAEDVNIYNRRFHYNDSDGVSGFHE